MVSLFITPDKLKYLYQEKKINSEYIIIDVRERSEFNKERLKYAINIEFDMIIKSPCLLNVYINKILILYCDSGTRSLYATREIRRKGFSACSLTGGYSNFKKLTNS